MLDVRLFPDHSIVEAQICGRALVYRLGAAGRHLAMNSLAVLLAAKALGVDLDAAAGALAFLRRAAGARRKADARRPRTAPYTLIDESYNANPASMRAAFALAGALPLAQPGRRVAVLGDMLELGPARGAMHAGLAADLIANRIELVFTAGPLMQSLFEALPALDAGRLAPTAASLAPDVAAAIQAPETWSSSRDRTAAR